MRFHCIIYVLAMHSLAAASRPRLSETEPNWFMFKTSSYAFGGRIEPLLHTKKHFINNVVVSFL